MPNTMNALIFAMLLIPDHLHGYIEKLKKKYPAIPTDWKIKTCVAFVKIAAVLLKHIKITRILAA